MILQHVAEILNLRNIASNVNYWNVHLAFWWIAETSVASRDVVSKDHPNTGAYAPYVKIKWPLFLAHWRRARSYLTPVFSCPRKSRAPRLFRLPKISPGGSAKRAIFHRPRAHAKTCKHQYSPSIEPDKTVACFIELPKWRIPGFRGRNMASSYPPLNVCSNFPRLLPIKFARVFGKWGYVR